MITERLEQLGIVLPPVFPPAGNYVACVVDGGLVYVSGHGPVDGDKVITGKVGSDLTFEQAHEAARLTALSLLATLRAELGDLDRIARIVKVFGMVNAARASTGPPPSSMAARTCSSRPSGSPAGTRAAQSAWPSCPSTSRSRSS